MCIVFLFTHFFHIALNSTLSYWSLSSNTSSLLHFWPCFPLLSVHKRGALEGSVLPGILKPKRVRHEIRIIRHEIRIIRHQRQRSPIFSGGKTLLLRWDSYGGKGGALLIKRVGMAHNVRQFCWELELEFAARKKRSHMRSLFKCRRYVIFGAIHYLSFLSWCCEEILWHLKDDNYTIFIQRCRRNNHYYYSVCTKKTRLGYAFKVGHKKFLPLLVAKSQEDL